MSISVEIPTLLRPLTGGLKRLDADGATVYEVLQQLEQRYPGLQDRLLKDGAVRRFMNLYVNDEDIRFAQELATPVSAGDCLTILPAVAGGAAGEGAR
ncbi:MoaD/ThiS family protein [Parachitinimonas caeni]|uniref:MoaD/ThiS family protein n=1 Tax=Parachitinimonas caeni TaxID=3031301 RepID=A0ABT7E301_9NEIS|nr:MoaD/ThiS family protein [Parachitinimonas caeni]MDK2126690.1 MoaD/ThiS family protein [Parachitinimonas caeni]